MRRTAVILDDHPLWLEAVQSVLERVDVVVAARATNRDDALARIAEHRPDVFLTELVIGGDEAATMDIITAALEHVPSLKVIVLSATSDGRSVRQAFAAGVVAYVLKTAHPDDLASAIRQAFEHSFFLAPRTALSLVGSLALRDEAAEWLTPREREIVGLAGQGYTNARIARALWVTEQTVKFHLSNVYRKLGVTNRTEAARWAQLNGLVKDARSALTAS